jgi:hypothetical protein
MWLRTVDSASPPPISSTPVIDVETNCPPDLTDPDRHLRLGMKCFLSPSQHPLLPRLRRLRPLVLPQAKFSAVSNHLAQNDGDYPWSPNVPDSFKEWQPFLGKPHKGV